MAPAKSSPTPPSRSFGTLVWRAIRLRCPLCGAGRLYASWFKMRPECPVCQAKFEREAGFFLGSIYFNYGLTAVIATIVYLVLFFLRLDSHPLATIGPLVFVILFPLWFHRYARSLWLGFDQFMDPREETKPE